MKNINLRDLPEDLVRKAKACAALRGMTLKDFVMQAIAKATQEDLPLMATASIIPGARTESKRKGRRG